MSIRIDTDKCTGCGRCREVCPGSLLYADQNGKTYIRFPKDCWGCTSCLKECRYNAVKYFLGADIGGKGEYLETRIDGELLHWIINKQDGSKKIVTIDRNRANEY